MRSKSDNVDITINDEADEVIKELFDLSKERYQNNLESVQGCEFVFDYVHLLYYKRHKIDPDRGGSYIDSPDWIKNKNTTINSINKKDKCFQYAVTVPLNHEEIGKNAERITKIKPFINKYKWEGINLPSEKDDWKKFEKNNVTIALNVLYVEKERIYAAYVSKNNSNHEEQVVLLMIPNGEGRRWHYLAVKKISALLRGITSKKWFVVRIAFIPSEQKTNLNRIRKYVKIKIFVM